MASPTRKRAAAGTRGSPGIVMISPDITTTNPAPADGRNSRTVNSCPVGRPSRDGSSDSEYCVLATQIGHSSCPSRRARRRFSSARRCHVIVSAP